MELPPGLVDPIFMCELALELKMSVGELGFRMSAHELSVMWPAYFAWREREREREENRQDRRSMLTMGR
jgi:hypothetical protein